MCTKYSPHRLHLPGCAGGGNGAVVEAADHARADLERGGGSAPNPKAHFHLYEVRPPPPHLPRLEVRSLTSVLAALSYT